MRGKSIYSGYFTYIKPVVRLPIVRTYGTAIFTIFIMAIFVSFAIKPTVETILVLQKKLENSNQVLEQIKIKAENLSLGKQNYQDLDPSVKGRIQSAIPDTVELKTLIQTLEGVARKYEASVSALQILPQTLETKQENKVGMVSEIDFIFNIEGDYRNLISILQDFQTSSRLVSIDKLILTKISEGPGVIMSISGKALYIK